MPEMWVQMVKHSTVISTFAGCGGSSLGYKLAGFRELLAVEWDQNAVDTFRLNFPGVPVYHGDIAKLTGAECMRLAGLSGPGELDVLDGSPPCQGFSTAGKRKFDDPRNSLFKEFARLLGELQPKVFVMENVTGMVKGCMKQAYLTIITTLRDCGYDCKGEVLNAMYYNVPQSRERVIIIGVRNDLGIEPSHPKPQTKPIPAGTVKTIPEPRLANSERVDRMALRLRQGMSGDELPESKGNAFGLQRIDPRKPCPTILKGWTAGTGLLHWTENRFISVPEMAQLASFGIEYKWQGSPKQAVERIGNSVPPNLMRAIAEHVRDKLLTPTPALHSENMAKP
jgi:DNA (cytosine-5)-methyltransferase 1